MAKHLAGPSGDASEELLDSLHDVKFSRERRALPVPSKPVLAGSAAAVVLAGVGVGVWLMSGDDAGEPEAPGASGSVCAQYAELTADPLVVQSARDGDRSVRDELTNVAAALRELSTQVDDENFFKAVLSTAIAYDGMAGGLNAKDKEQVRNSADQRDLMVTYVATEVCPR